MQKIWLLCLYSFLDILFFVIYSGPCEAFILCLFICTDGSICVEAVTFDLVQSCHQALVDNMYKCEKQYCTIRLQCEGYT